MNTEANMMMTTLFHKAHSSSPGGATVCSRGRKPPEQRRTISPKPRRGDRRLSLVVAFGALLFSTVPIGARAQESGDEIAVLLERMSFNNAEKPDILGKELAELDAANLARLCDMLVEPGTGNDTKPRMALHALTWHLGSAGTATQRDTYVDALCAALEDDKPREVKAFLIRQLQLAGDARAVPTLAAHLTEHDFVDAAAQALLAIGSDQAMNAIVAAAKRTDGDTHIKLLSALLQGGNAEALRRLGQAGLAFEFVEEHAELPTLDYVRMVAACDPTLAAPGFLEMLDRGFWREKTKPGEWWLQTQMTALFLEIADGLTSTGQRESGVRMYRGLLDQVDDPADVHIRCAALHGLARAIGAEATPEVIAALTSEDAEYRAAAFEIAIGLSGPGVTDAYVLEFHKATAGARAGILDVLRQRGDAAALPVALAGLKDEDKVVRLAAVVAAAALGHEQAVEPFVAFLETADEDEREAMADALTRVPGKAVSTAIHWVLYNHRQHPDRRTPHAIPLLLNVVAQRKEKPQLDNAYRWINSSNEEIQVAAINAVGALADQRAARRLLSLLKKTESQAVREALESALVATCQRADSAAQRAAPILKAITQAVEQDDPREYGSLLRVAAQLGGAESRVRLLVAAHDARSEVKEAAIRAFHAWPDSSAAEAVLELADSQTDTKLHVLAMRAYLRMVGLDEDRPAAKTLKMYAGALDVARRAEERKQVLSGLAEVKDVETLAVLSPYLDDEQLRSEAGSAMIGVARGLLPTGWAPAREALKQVIAKVNDERVRRHAEDVLKEVAEHEDYITDWLASGPYRQGNKKGNELFDVPFPPEDPDAENVEWKQQPVTRDPARYWFIDLARSCGGSHPVGYLRTYLWSPNTQEVLLELGSDDGIKVWLNGEVIHANNVPRGCGRAQDKVKATLNQGWNELLLKITNVGGAWAACARVRAPDGSHLEGLKVEARRET